MIRKSLLLTALAVLGFAAGNMVRPSRASATQACEWNVCNTESGNCSTTDVNKNCRETTPSGCQSSACTN